MFARFRVNSVTTFRSSGTVSVMHPIDLARERLERLLGLGPAQARRAVQETLDCFERSVDEYIADRHRELQAQGTRNQAIYDIIAGELPSLRFAAPPLSARQIRRRIYG